MNRRLFFAGLLTLLALSCVACDLCAIYSATDARGESSGGFHFSVAEQFISFGTPRFEGKEVSSNGDFVDSSITHLVPGYNFSERFGVSLNVPVVYRSFQRSDFRYSLTGPPVFEVQRDTESGLGDAALIGRLAVLDLREMKRGIVVNLLAGVKFPTGDTDRIRDEVEQTIIFDSLLPPGTPHDPLGHSVSGVHQHELSPGSGSWDGIFGVTLNSRWDRWFFNAQVQYYLRTEGEDFEFGDELLVSGGPGVYLITDKRYTLSLQGAAVYETMARDRVLGRKSDRTGMTAWYLGPQLGFTWGDRFSAQAGADLPLVISNNGFQNVPDYRFHGGFTLRF
jgi:hypothetical protein